MNIKDLEYFDCLCEEKSFTKAAEKLFISQPSISMSIKRLEEELNSKLIIRNKYSKEVKITNEGLIFRKRVKNILSELNEAKAELLKCKFKKIKLGVPPIIGTYFLPKFFDSLSNNDFIQNIEFVQCGSKKMEEMIIDGSVDIALLASLSPIFNENLNSTPLYKDKFVMCVSKNNLISKDPELNFSKLKDSQFIVLGKDSLHLNLLKQLFDEFHIEDSKICCVDEIQTVKSLIAANFGVGVLASMAVQDLKGVVVKELSNSIPFYISIATKKGHFLSEIEEKLIEIVTTQSELKSTRISK